MSNSNSDTRIKLACTDEFCLTGFDLSSETRPFNATLEFESAGEKQVENVVLEVPVDAHIGHIKHFMSCAVREHIEPQGSSYGIMRFRIDGGTAKLTRWQRLQDFWFRLTWRGKPLTSSHFVPIWPRMPMPAQAA